MYILTNGVYSYLVKRILHVDIPHFSNNSSTIIQVVFIFANKECHEEEGGKEAMKVSIVRDA